MEKKKILYVTHEMDPYAAITAFSKTARALPQKMQERGMEIRVFMPRYGQINERRHRLHEVIRLSGINVSVGETDNPMIIKVASLPAAKMQIYFLDNDDYFHRKEYFYDKNEKFFSDNDERIIFFNKGVVEILLKLGWNPDIIHCHGWMSSLVPLYARTTYKNEPVFKNARVIYSVIDKDFSSSLGTDFAKKASINGAMKENKEILSNPDCNDLFITGVTYADAVTILSDKVDDSVMDCVNSLNKPVLEYHDPESEEFINIYQDFYEQIAALV
jgi:starch synthase